jgi:hypothetical protein
LFGKGGSATAKQVFTSTFLKMALSRHDWGKFKGFHVSHFPFVADKLELGGKAISKS